MFCLSKSEIRRVLGAINLDKYVFVDISREADHLERTKPITLCTQADH